MKRSMNKGHTSRASEIERGREGEREGERERVKEREREAGWRGIEEKGQPH